MSGCNIALYNRAFTIFARFGLVIVVLASDGAWLKRNRGHC